MAAFFPLAVLPSGVSPAPGHAHRHRPDGSDQSAHVMAVPVAYRLIRFCDGLRFGKRKSLVAIARQCGVEFRFQEFLDEAANAGPHPGFQGIEPIFSGEKRCFGRFRRCFCGIRFHGVISLGATTPIRFEHAAIPHSAIQHLYSCRHAASNRPSPAPRQSGATAGRGRQHFHQQITLDFQDSR